MLSVWEDFVLYRFNKYISSCSYYLMQLRLKEKGMYYRG